MKVHYWKWSQDTYKNLFDWFKDRNERFGLFSPESLISDSNSNSTFKPGQMLLVYRIFSCMTREEFAKRLGIGSHLLWQLESGNYEIKLVKTTEKYIDILKGILKNNSFSFTEFLKLLDEIKTKIKRRQAEGGILQNKLYPYEKRKWGKKAGETTKEKYGVAYYKRISKLGAGKNKPNPDKTRRLYGKDFFSRMGKIGIQKMIRLYKHKKHEWSVKSVENSLPTEQEIRILETFKKYGLNPELHKTIATQNRVIGNFDFFFKNFNLIIETMNYSYKDSSLAKILFKLSLFRKLKNYKIIFILPENSPVENILVLLKNKVIPIFDTNENIARLVEDIKIKSIDFDKWSKITTLQMAEYLRKIKSKRENGFIARKNQKLNENEKKVKYELNQLGIKFTPRFVLNGPYNLKRVTDFFCENNGKRFILEVTSSKNFEDCAIRILGKFFAYKEFYEPKTRLIGIVFCPNISKNLFETNFFVKELVRISDKVVINDLSQIKGVLHD